jgi:CBS domain-containing protein
MRSCRDGTREHIEQYQNCPAAPRWSKPGHGRRQMIVKAILSAKGGDVISIDPTATLDTAVKTLAEHKIGALLVLGTDRRVIGILSERDIVRALAERGAGVLSEPLAQVMTRKVITCSESDSVGVLMERMTTGKFRHLPVIEDDRVIGVVSIGDVVKHRLQEIEQESAALRDYIQTA